VDDIARVDGWWPVAGSWKLATCGTDALMSRDERPARSETASEVNAAHARKSPSAGAGWNTDPSDEESIRFGCSMLSRVRLRQGRSGKHGTLEPIRCSLGYALHGPDDVAKCLAVEGPSECWKVIPTWRISVQTDRPATGSGNGKAAPLAVPPDVTTDARPLSQLSANGHAAPVDAPPGSPLRERGDAETVAAMDVEMDMDVVDDREIDINLLPDPHPSPQPHALRLPLRGAGECDDDA